MNTARSSYLLNNLYKDYTESENVSDGLVTFIKMLVKNPNFPLLYTLIGKIFEEQSKFKAAGTFYYISAEMANKKNNWTRFTSFSHRNNLDLERVLGYMHLYALDATDYHTQKELAFNVKRTMFMQNDDVQKQMVMEQIIQFYNENFEIFHMQRDQKTAQLVIGYIQFVKSQYKEAALLLEDHLEYDEHIKMTYFLLVKGEL